MQVVLTKGTPSRRARNPLELQRTKETTSLQVNIFKNLFTVPFYKERKNLFELLIKHTGIKNEIWHLQYISNLFQLSQIA